VHGVYNVAGPGAVPLRCALDAIGRPHFAIPDPPAHALISALFNVGIYGFPPGAIDFLKYPCTVTDERFRKATGFVPRRKLAEIFASVPT